MRSLLLLLTLISSSLFAATTWETRVHDVDRGSPGEEILVFFSNGQVGRIHPHKVETLSELESAHSLGNWVLVTLSEKGEVKEVKESDRKEIQRFSPGASKLLSQDYVPSVVESYDVARSLFYEMRQSPVHNSECWQRAHVWAYEWRINHNLFTSKAWIFFTRKYIRANPDLTWWFHVAPMIHVKMDGVVKERIMDRKFGNAPLMIKKWTDTFIRSRETCRQVDTYSDHANYQDSASCYLMKSSMYYVQPMDLELLEKFDTIRDRWVEAELVDAYEKAFLIKQESESQAEGE